MPTIEMDITGLEPEGVSQFRYSLAFAAEEIEDYNLADDGKLTLTFADAGAEPSVRSKVERLAQRYAQSTFGVKRVIHFEQSRELPEIDAWAQMLERKLVTPVGDGHVVLRGMAAKLYRTLDRAVLRKFADEFASEEEVFPSTISNKTLHRINHFTSFPEHVDFIAHLKEDLDVLQGFAEDCRTDGWSPGAHADRMAESEFAITPSCCYHTYEAMENWELDADKGRSVTMISDVHRFESRNQTSMSRLRAYHVRDVVWVGHPKYVRACRARADELIIDFAKRWELDCTVENANDMFFTDDYAVKASFQRQQEAKRELKLTVPAEKRSIAVFSSNFHASTFCKAFNITVNGRTGVSACIGFGYERWVYALLAQFGFDPNHWPAALKEDYDRYGDY